MENLQRSNPLPTGQVLGSVGYGSGLQHNPNRVLESEGFKKALAEFGLTEELITVSLVEDIKAKPKARVKELGLGAEILGMKKREFEPPKSAVSATYNFIFSSEVQAKVKQINEEIKSQLIHVETTETPLETE